MVSPSWRGPHLSGWHRQGPLPRWHSGFIAGASASCSAAVSRRARERTRNAAASSTLHRNNASTTRPATTTIHAATGGTTSPITIVSTDRRAPLVHRQLLRCLHCPYALTKHSCDLWVPAAFLTASRSRVGFGS